MSINEAGVNYLTNLKPISYNDLKTLSGLYFFNSTPNNSNLKKLLNLKLLNFAAKNSTWPNYLINQNSMIDSNFNLINKSNSVFNSINLPNDSFFESTGSFYNTEGYV